MNCKHLGEIVGQRISSKGHRDIFRCNHPTATAMGETTEMFCKDCQYHEPRSGQSSTLPAVKTIRPIDSVQRPSEPGVFTSVKGLSMGLEGLWRNGRVFMVLGGPGLRRLPLDLLRQRGIVTFGTNNSPAVVRPDFWVFGDKTRKFHHGIWRDPGILKFVPQSRRRDAIRLKEGGKFIWSEDRVDDMPGVVCFQRNAFFDPAKFLEGGTVCWGNREKHARVNGRPKFFSVMLAAIHLCWFLGFEEVYLLGCDFKMSSVNRYAFPQGRTSDAIHSNNSLFKTLDWAFAELEPHFRAAGFRVYNCQPGSELQAFERLDYEAAIDRATTGIPEELDTDGWYDEKKEKGKRKKKGRKKGKAEDSQPQGSSANAVRGD